MDPHIQKEQKIFILNVHLKKEEGREGEGEEDEEEERRKRREGRGGGGEKSLSNHVYLEMLI